MTANLGFLPVPVTGEDKEHRRQMAEKINSILGGKVNATVDVTLSTAATTTVSDPRVFQTSYLMWEPLSSAAADASAGIWCPSSTIVKGAAVLHHAASSVAHPYRVLIIG